MWTFKAPNGEKLIVRDANLISLMKRQGFELVDDADTELEALRAQAKALGIRNAHSMGKERLLEKIAEAKKE